MSTQKGSVSRHGGAEDATADDAGTPGSEADYDEDDGGGDGEPEPLSLDVVFEILKNQRRRSVLRYLQHHDERVVLGELAEHIAAEENDTTVESLTAQQRKRVYVGLYQCHLPKMDDAGVVEFDRNRGIVELGESADQLVDYLDTGEEVAHEWPRYYLGLAAGGFVLVGIGQAGLYPAGWMTDVLVMAVIASFAGVAALQERDSPAE